MAKAQKKQPLTGLVPDPIVAKELGVCRMTLWRRTKDPAYADADFPPQIKVKGPNGSVRNYRDRKALEAWRAKQHQRDHVHDRMAVLMREVARVNRKLERALDRDMAEMREDGKRLAADKAALRAEAKRLNITLPKP